MFQTLVKLLQYKRGKRKQADINQTDYGCWQTPPTDIMENILQCLNIGDRIRSSMVCKHWRSIAMRRDICCAPQFPWLLLRQHSSKYLSFSSLSEGRVVEMKLPKRSRGWLISSSKGWLIIAKEQGLNSRVLLLNPISRAQYKLPSLSTIPSFQNLVNEKESYPASIGSFFLLKTVLSSSNISECTVAAVFTPTQELGLCRPGGKSWSVFQLLDAIQNDFYADILFFRGMLYAVVHSDSMARGSVAARTLNFGDGAVELKLFCNVDDELEIDERIQDHGHYFLMLKATFRSYLLESATDTEVLLIHKTIDVFRSNYFDRDYTRTSYFTVYKIDPENGNNFLRKQSLGNQILFLARFGSPLSFQASVFKGLKGNCIYFQANGLLQYSAPPQLSNESGIFYLDGEKIERSFTNIGNSIECGISWFCPSLR